MIDAADLAALQQDMATMLLMDTCTLLRKNAAGTTWGGTNDSWVTLASGVPCSLVGVTAVGEVVQAERVTDVAAYRITIPVSVQQATPITAKDRIQVRAALYEVIQVLMDAGTFTLTVPIQCRLIT